MPYQNCIKTPPKQPIWGRSLSESRLPKLLRQQGTDGDIGGSSRYSGAKGRWFESTRAYHKFFKITAQSRGKSGYPTNYPTKTLPIPFVHCTLPGSTGDGFASTSLHISASISSTAARTLSGISRMYQPVISSVECRNCAWASFGDPWR